MKLLRSAPAGQQRLRRTGAASSVARSLAEAADHLDAERQAARIGEARHVHAGRSHQGPQPVEGRRAGRAEALRRGARRRRRQDHVDVGHQIGQRAARLARGAAGVVIGVGADGKAALDQFAARPWRAGPWSARIRRRASAPPRRPGWWRERGTPPASTGVSLMSRTRALAAEAARATLSSAAIMSSLAAGQGWSRSTPMRGDDGVPAVDAQIAVADRRRGEGHVGDRGREQAGGVEMPGHAFHADGRQQPVGRLEAGDAAKARRPDHRAAGLACRSRSERSPRRRPPPSPTTSRPACARGCAGCGSCPDRDGRTRW